MRINIYIISKCQFFLTKSQSLVSFSLIVLNKKNKNIMHIVKWIISTEAKPSQIIINNTI